MTPTDPALLRVFQRVAHRTHLHEVGRPGAARPTTTSGAAGTRTIRPERRRPVTEPGAQRPAPRRFGPGTTARKVTWS